MDRELLQDSDAVNESFWDGLGVEFEAKYIFDFRGAPRGPSPTYDSKNKCDFNFKVTLTNNLFLKIKPRRL